MHSPRPSPCSSMARSRCASARPSVCRFFSLSPGRAGTGPFGRVCARSAKQRSAPPGGLNLMWSKWLARLLLAGAALPAAAEPRVPGMDAQLEADLARADYLFVWDIDRRTLGKGDSYRTLRTYYDGLMFALTEARRLV